MTVDTWLSEQDPQVRDSHVDPFPDGRFICQYNLAILRYPFHSKEMFSFRERLLSVHEEAEKDPDYVGRYEGEHSAEGYIMPETDLPRLIGNLTGWRSIKALKNFTFHNVEHREVMLRKKEWFVPQPAGMRPYNVLYVTDRIDLDDAKLCLHSLQNDGPSPFAFTWKEAHLCGF